MKKLLEKKKRTEVNRRKRSERLAGHPDRMLSRKIQRVPACVGRIAAQTAWAHNDGVSCF